MKQKIISFILFTVISTVGFAKDKASLNDESIYSLHTTWLNQNSEPVKLEHFKGTPVVLAMIYTSCQAACPMIVADIQKIEKAIAAKSTEKVQYALFSFDSEKDQPAELKNFAKAHSLDLRQWTLLTAQSEAVRELSAVLGIQYKKSLEGDFSHSNIITILDADGKIKYQQVGLKQDPKISADIILDLLKKK